MESIRALKVRESLGLSFFSKNAILFAVEFEGPPHGEDSVLDTRIEGFNTPWLHSQDRPSRAIFGFNVCIISLYLPNQCNKKTTISVVSVNVGERASYLLSHIRLLLFCPDY